MISFDAKAAQGGFAAGPAFLWESRADHSRKEQAADCARPETIREPLQGREEKNAYQAGNAEEECAKLDAAVAELDRRLSVRRDAAEKTEVQLIEAQLMILHDEGYTGFARSRILQGDCMSAPQALAEAKDSLCAKLISGGNAYIMERCEDVRGMTSVLTGILTGKEARLPEKPCILVAEELSPSSLSMVSPELILGILTETGSPTSHVSVLAGTLGVPYLYGVDSLTEKVREGDYLILDAGKGTVCVNPPGEERESAEKRQAEERKAREELRTQAAGLVTKTKICANIAGLQEVEALIRSGADGVGLFRSEFLFLNRDDAPTEEEQFLAYQQVAAAMEGKEVVIRTMDIGSDKQAKWLPVQGENNPALGLRGLRLSLEHRELFRTQLRALLRAAACGNLKIMVPMVTSEWEIDEVVREMKTAAKELESREVPWRLPELGVMIETPAAVMVAGDLAKKACFFSIGTNDLTQYTLALDREARGLDRFYDPLHKAVFEMVGMTVRAAHGSGISVAVCGELGGNPDAIERLIGLGVDELSVSVGNVGRTRKLAAGAEERIAAGMEGQEAPGNVNQPGAGTEERPAAGSEKKPYTAEHMRGCGGIKAPADGELIPMPEIPDEVFSGGMMGECLGILPSNGTIYAPITGIVASVAKSRHALCFKNEEDQILVHVGIDTVKLLGEGFSVKVKEGQKVEQGQPVMEADISLIRERGFNPMVVVIRLGD